MGLRRLRAERQTLNKNNSHCPNIHLKSFLVYLIYFPLLVSHVFAFGLKNFIVVKKELSAKKTVNTGMAAVVCSIDKIMAQI